MDHPRRNGAHHGVFRVTTRATPQPAARPATAAHITRDKISLEAIVNVMVQQGLCSEEQLLAEEERLRAVKQTVSNLHFQPVRRKKGAAAGKPKKNPLKRWASQRRWTRQVGSLLFGWRWRKYKKKERSGLSGQNPPRTT